jgi:hypothetical protein
MYEAPPPATKTQKGPRREATSINEEDRPLNVKNNNPYD